MKSRKIIAGVDEVGRGSLVGSVYSAAVILPDETSIDTIRDSKQLSEKKRISISSNIVSQSKCVSIGIASKDEIDKINIHHATLLSMKRAINNLVIKPDLILIDGLYTPDVDYKCESIVKGDTKVKEIAAASIIAKVSRDNEMKFIHNKFKMYLFNKNKGYGTPKHIEAIKCYGKTIYHRNSFIK